MDRIHNGSQVVPSIDPSKWIVPLIGWEADCTSKMAIQFEGVIDTPLDIFK
jgi:hypothetical protein